MGGSAALQWERLSCQGCSCCFCAQRQDLRTGSKDLTLIKFRSMLFLTIAMMALYYALNRWSVLPSGHLLKRRRGYYFKLSLSFFCAGMMALSLRSFLSSPSPSSRR